MDIDDMIYASLLFSCLGFTYFYRQIKDIKRKKWIGTSLGFLLVLGVSGFHALHSFLMFLFNAGIILLLPKTQCHLVSFAFTFSHLFFIRTTTYFGIPYLPSHTNVIQMMMTLKLVGLAFEVNNGYLLQRCKNETEKTIEEKLKNDSNNINPSFEDIFHYTFNYLGILTGPYYRYKTFRDYFHLPFSTRAPWKEATLQKLTWVPLFILLLTVSNHYWPISYALTEEFYGDHSWLYRFWYTWPTFFSFRMRIYAGVLTAESVYTMAGLGAYPTLSEPKPGHGPTKLFKKTTQNPTQMADEEYNFETIRNVNPYGADFCTTVRDGMKNWNMCIQYWLVITVYKRFPYKQFRIVITMLVSAFWHGMYTGYYVCICSVPFYLALEDVYIQLFLKDNKGFYLKMGEWIIWFLKMQTLSYLGIAFHLLGFQEVVRYYRSIYYSGFIGSAMLYIIGLLILKVRKSKVRKLDKILNNRN